MLRPQRYIYTQEEAGWLDTQNHFLRAILAAIIKSDGPLHLHNMTLTVCPQSGEPLMQIERVTTG